MTTDLIAHVKPDPRGRVALSKALEVLNERLMTAVSAFDVLLNDDGTLTLRPMVTVPAELASQLSHADWARVSAIITEQAEPNDALRAAADRYRTLTDSGMIQSHLDRPRDDAKQTPAKNAVTSKPKIGHEHDEHQEHTRVHEHVEHPTVRKKALKHRRSVHSR